MHLFISHAGRDRAWAEWVAWQLREAGFSIELDTWDWAAGDNLILKMSNALDAADRVIALFSSAYFESHQYTADQWSATLVKDSTGLQKLIPLRVEDTRVPRILAPLIAPRLYGLDEAEAQRVLLEAVGGPRTPNGPPDFPGAAAVLTHAGPPRMPGTLPGVWNVPPRNPAFVGRDGLIVRLRERLSSGGAHRIQVFTGMGGVGKTQLAAEYAHRFASDYDVVWWVRSDQAELVGEQIAAAAVEIGLVESGSDITVSQRALGRRLRGTGRWLIVFDNANDPKSIRQWLPDGPGHVIITSRTPEWTEVAEPIDVSLFVRSESTALLRRRLHNIDPQDAESLARALGDLPLALAQAAGTLAETGMTIADYTDLLATQAGRLLDDGQPVSYPVSLAAVVSLAIMQLDEADPAARQLVELCAFMAAAPIPVSVFHAGSSVLAEPLRAIAAQKLPLRLALGRIGRVGLARVDSTGLQLHPLVQAILRDKLEPPRRFRLAQIYVQLLAASHPGHPDDPQTWRAWSTLLPHLLAGDPAGTDFIELRAMTLDACRYLLVRENTRAGLELAEHLLRNWRVRLGVDHPHTLTAAVRLGHGFYAAARFPEALELYQEVRAIRLQLLGADDLETLRAANGVAVNLRALGRVDEALELDRDTFARRRRVLGDLHRETLLSATNLSADLRAAGEFEEAKVLNEQTSRRYRDALGENHPDTLRSTHNLAEVQRQIGRIDLSLELDRQTFQRRRRVLGEDHPETLRSATNLAADLRATGRQEQATELEKETLARCRKVFGDDHPITQTLADRLGRSRT